MRRGIRAPVNMLDYAQRGLAGGLVALTVYGLYEMVVVHNATMKAGEGECFRQDAFAKRNRDQEALALAAAQEEEKIAARAEAAQSASRPGSS